jgi:hypothetical protein
MLAQDINISIYKQLLVTDLKLALPQKPINPVHITPNSCLDIAWANTIHGMVGQHMSSHQHATPQQHTATK